MKKATAGHIIPAESKSYNERLFKGGIRKYFHEARYIWIQKALKRLAIVQATVLELGCFDGKLLSYLPFKPELYIGYDANWEGGLDLAKAKWKAFPNYQFRYCNDVSEFNPGSNSSDISVCMETVEHLPSQQLDAYLTKLSAATKNYIFISVPNEKGPLVFFKYATKKLFLQVDEPYSIRELAYASVGDLSKVKRIEYGHKGFDYQELLERLSKHFEIITVQPIPFSFLPAWMNFSIGIIAKPLAVER
jgi:hypothetical protein